MVCTASLLSIRFRRQVQGFGVKLGPCAHDEVVTLFTSIPCMVVGGWNIITVNKNREQKQGQRRDIL
jgi:hypothetical protein